MFETVIKDKMVFLTGGKSDPCQFTYQADQGVDDAKPFILDKVYKHLEKLKSHAHFSSALNKMQPHIFIDHLASCFKQPDQLSVLLLVCYKLNPAGVGEWTRPAPVSCHHDFVSCTQTAAGHRRAATL